MLIGMPSVLPPADYVERRGRSLLGYRDIGLTDLKHLFAVIAVESGLAVMHIVGVTPEAPSLETALGGRKPQAEYVVGKKELIEAYQLANTTSDRDIDFIHWVALI